MVLRFRGFELTLRRHQLVEHGVESGGDLDHLARAGQRGTKPGVARADALGGSAQIKHRQDNPAMDKQRQEQCKQQHACAHYAIVDCVFPRLRVNALGRYTDHAEPAAMRDRPERIEAFDPICACRYFRSVFSLKDGVVDADPAHILSHHLFGAKRSCNHGAFAVEDAGDAAFGQRRTHDQRQELQQIKDDICRPSGATLRVPYRLGEHKNGFAGKYAALGGAYDEGVRALEIDQPRQPPQTGESAVCGGHRRADNLALQIHRADVGQHRVSALQFADPAVAAVRCELTDQRALGQHSECALEIADRLFDVCSVHVRQMFYKLVGLRNFGCGRHAHLIGDQCQQRQGHRQREHREKRAYRIVPQRDVARTAIGRRSGKFEESPQRQHAGTQPQHRVTYWSRPDGVFPSGGVRTSCGAQRQVPGCLKAGQGGNREDQGEPQQGRVSEVDEHCALLSEKR